MFLYYRHVRKTCAFHDALQAGKQKEVYPPYSPDLAPAGASGTGKSERVNICWPMYVCMYERTTFMY
jgi:hypothetical protein